MSVRFLLLCAMAALILGGCPDPEVDGTSVTHTTPEGRRLSATYKRPASSVAVPTLLLLHQPGPTNSRHDFDDIWESLVGEGYGLVAPDLQSHGRSDSGGPWEELALDPAAYPDDVKAWLDFIAEREEAGDPVRRDAVGIIGLGTSASLGAAAIGKGYVDCLVAISATIEETNALHPGFDPYVGDDDDSAEARGDDDDSAGDDDDDGPSGVVDPALALHTTRWMAGTFDEPAGSDAVPLRDATDGDVDLIQVEADAHGREILWMNDEMKLAVLQWCGDKF